jgi:O-antigen/teichoic acid export membrane protein
LGTEKVHSSQVRWDVFQIPVRTPDKILEDPRSLERLASTGFAYMTTVDNPGTIRQTAETDRASAVDPPVGVFPDIAAMDKCLVEGVIWTASAKWTTQVISWVSMLIIARLLSPSDFGLVGMAAVYFALAQNFSEFGFGTAVVTLRDLTDEQVRGINTFCLLSGLAAFALSCALAVPLGMFFRSPQLPAVAVTMSVTFLISGFQTVPYALLQKELKFRLLSMIDAAKILAQALSVLVCALLGFRYWSLVIGNVVAAATGAILPLAFRPTGFVRPRFHSIKRAVTFSWHVLVSRMAWSLYSDADFIIAGRTLGAAPLGAYTLAWNLANAPVEKITSLVTRVTPAFLSAVQTDHASLRRYLRTLTKGISLITTPLTLGLALTAREFVPLALGVKWESATVPLELLAVYASFRSITALLGQVLIALGDTRFVMWNTMAALLFLPTAFFIGSGWGATGIAWAWILGFPFVVFPLYMRTFSGIEMEIGEYMGAVLPALKGSLAMTAVVLLLKWLLHSGWPLYLRFGIEVLAGGTAYVLTLTGFHRYRFSVFWNFVRALRDPVRMNAVVKETAPL